MTFVRKMSDAVYSIERFLAIILLGFMVTSIMLGVLFRYFFNSPLSWSDEFGLFALVWVTFIGGSMSIKKKKAATVSFVMDKLPERIRHILLGVAFFISVVFCFFTFYLSLEWISNPTMLLQKSSAVGLPMIIPYIGIPLGILFMGIHSLDLFVGIFHKQKSEEI